MANYYYVLHSKVMPGVYKVGISNDWRRRFEEHGGAAKWDLVDQCNVGSRETARRFEQRQLRRYESRRIRKGCEDLALTEAQLQELREAMREASAPKESKAHLVGSACAAPRNLERPKSEPVASGTYRKSGDQLTGAVTTFQRHIAPQGPQEHPARVLQFKPKEPDPVSAGDCIYTAALVGLVLTGLIAAGSLLSRHLECGASYCQIQWVNR